jgi:signal transduction histidine kinase
VVGVFSCWPIASRGPNALKNVVDQPIGARFYRGNGTSGEDAVADGSGLGLAIARQIAESHEGRLVLVSHGTAGSTFVLWLPDHAMNRSAGRTDAPPEGDPLLG